MRCRLPIFPVVSHPLETGLVVPGFHKRLRLLGATVEIGPEDIIFVYVVVDGRLWRVAGSGFIEDYSAGGFGGAFRAAGRHGPGYWGADDCGEFFGCGGSAESWSSSRVEVSGGGDGYGGGLGGGAGLFPGEGFW